ncbi:hypothetical protein ACSLBF_21170 (plasmid) [Pseudoalteromonas sp. T1lg65]|uniref:hypothetical protein n=1 Tax=Pseudoalteromonas sp. T1lg65 TaxID=2077101 RepID=UPI003F78B827
MGLSQQEHSELRRIGERIKKTLTAVMRSLPQTAYSIGGFARYVGCHRSNSQRLFNAYKSKQGEQVLYHLPGHQALIDLGEQLQPHLSNELYLQWQQIPELFAKVIPQYARSHAELKRLLESKDSEETELSSKDKRAQLYYAAKSLLGFSMEDIFSAYILRRNQYRPGFLQEIALISKTGIKRGTGAPPFVQFYTHPHTESFEGLQNITADSRVSTDVFSIGVAKELSTPGLTEAFASYSPSNSGLVFDPIKDAPEFDATFIFNNPDELVDPLTHDSKCSSTSISIKNPAKKLFLLVLIEKELDRKSTVNVGCYHGNQKVEEGKLSATDMWTERLPEFPELRLIDLNARPHLLLNSPSYSEKLNYLFRYAGLNTEDYSCYLLEVEFPIWSSTYRIYFEHE